MTGRNEEQEPGTEVAITDKKLLAQFAEMVTLIPAESGGGAERILAQILNAGQWDELDAPWETSKAEHLIGKKWWLDSAERRPSDFREGLGMFLVLRGRHQGSGHEVIMTTSSISVIGQVTRAYSIGALPMLVEVIVAERATQAGYRPHHLKIYASANKGAEHGAEPAEA